MNELDLTLAIHDYDHTRDLVSGLVPTPGIRLRPLALMTRLETRLTPWRRGLADGH